MKLDKKTKRALWIVLGVIAFIILSGVVTSALTANVWFGLLASFLALFVVVMVVVFSVFVIAVGKVLSEMDNTKNLG
jgi:uncharacterized membrane protein